MKSMVAGLIAVVAIGFAGPAMAQESEQVARALAPVALAQYNRAGSIDCASTGYKMMRCRVPWRDASLVRQLSDSSCVRGRTWGVERGAVWVDQGCAGRFVEAGRGGGGGYGPGPGAGGDWRPGAGWDRSIRVRCASQNYSYNMCQIDTGRGGSVHVEQQISKTRCQRGRTWGFNRAGIWVDGGCEAVFRVDRRWR